MTKHPRLLDDSPYSDPELSEDFLRLVNDPAAMAELFRHAPPSPPLTEEDLVRMLEAIALKDFEEHEQRRAEAIAADREVALVFPVKP